MHARHGLSRTLFCLALVGMPTIARADEVTAAFGLTINPALGAYHESFNDRVHVPPVPIPLVEGRVTTGPFELDLEGLPPVASIPNTDTINGHTSTVLSIAEGVARVWDPLHRYSGGIGETVYNQTTHYSDAIEIAGTGETQSSRVAGITYAGGYEIPFARGRIDAVVLYTPNMRGTQYTLYDIGTHPGRIDPEHAEQIDTALHYVRAAGRYGEFVLGIRYVNYTANYTRPGGGLSDRNVGVLPVFGYLIKR